MWYLYLSQRLPYSSHKYLLGIKICHGFFVKLHNVVRSLPAMDTCDIGVLLMNRYLVRTRLEGPISIIKGIYNTTVEGSYGPRFSMQPQTTILSRRRILSGFLALI